MRFGSETRPAGALEMHLPYRPIAAAVERDTGKLYLILFLGLGLLCATLFRIVMGASRRLRHQALHDALTDLPNRTLFYERVQQTIGAAPKGGPRVALLLVDLDRFKEINDTLGHHNGDALLKEVGPRMSGALRDTDTIARLGGDEFAVLLTDASGSRTATRVADRVAETLEEPFELQGLSVDLDASIGIAFYPEHGTDVDTLLQRADVAMYRAKEAQSGYEVYAPGRDKYSPERLALVGELRRAIDNLELVLYYQPKVELHSGSVIGGEALLLAASAPGRRGARRVHPARGADGPHASPDPVRAEGLPPAVPRLAAGGVLPERGRKPGYSQPPRPAALRGHRASAQQVERAPGLPRARDHGGDDHGRPGPVDGGPDPPQRHGCRPCRRRLRHGLLLPCLPEAAAGGRDQDGQVVRDEHDDQRERRRDRALDDRPRSQPRPSRRGRGGGERGDLDPAARTRLPRRPGLLPEPAGGPRRADDLAGRWTEASAASRAASASLPA